MTDDRKQDLHNQIVQFYRGGHSIRGIARQLGISRHQVGSVLAAHQADRDEGSRGTLPKLKQRRASSLDEYEESLAQLLERYPDITAVRAHEELSKLGFGGGYGIVKRRLRELRGARKAEWVQRFETGPAVQAQMDYSTYTIDFTSEGRRRVHLFSYLLAYTPLPSNWPKTVAKVARFLMAADSQSRHPRVRGRCAVAQWSEACD